MSAEPDDGLGGGDYGHAYGGVAASYSGHSNDELSSADPLLSRVEDDSIQMDINRESLKRKLMLRRTLPELVNQGIYPPLNVPPAYADRQKHLQRAQTGDRLNQKLKARPDRECLVQHHILEDTSVLVDRSLQEKQRLLKRSRLQSDLSGRLASRPGPLELVTKNILQDEIDPQLKDRLIDGEIPFMRTTEVDDPIRRHFHFDSYNFETDLDDVFNHGLDDSNSGIDFPLLTSDDSLPDGCISLTPTDLSVDQIFLEPSLRNALLPPATAPASVSVPSNIPQAPDITPLLKAGNKFQFNSQQVFNFIPTLQPISIQASNDVTTAIDSIASNGNFTGSVGKQRNVKKSKPKNMSKTKVIKFHEYRGPPSAVKSSVKHKVEPATNDDKSVPTSYHILLEQQQLFLQWQLDFQQRALLSRQQSETGQSVASNVVVAAAGVAKPAAAAVAAVQGNNSSSSSSSSSSLSSPSVGGYTSSNTGTSGVFIVRPSTMPSVAGALVAKTPIKLEDMKVPELKQECRRFNLSCSGAKPQLIERLLPHANKILSGLSKGIETRTLQSAIKTSSDPAASSGTSRVTSPLAGCFDSSSPNGTRFGGMFGSQPSIPITVETPPTRPSSIVPMDVDLGSSLNAERGFTSMAPPTMALQMFLLQHQQQQRAGRQTMSDQRSLSVSSDAPAQAKPQKLAATYSLPLTNGFVAPPNLAMTQQQPFVLLANPLLAHESHPMKLEENVMQPIHVNRNTKNARPNSAHLSSDELVLHQQRLIAELARSLEQSQLELLRTQEKARMQELQLTSHSAHSDVPKTSGGAANKSMLRSATNPLQLSKNINSNELQSLMPSSVTLPSMFLSSSDNNAMDDIMDVLMKRGELQESLNDKGDHNVLNNMNTSAVNIKPAFLIPQIASDHLKLSSELHDFSTSSNGGGVLSPFDVGYDMDMDSQFMSSGNDVTSSDGYSSNNQMVIPSEMTFDGNNDLDLSNGIFSSYGNMEWSGLDLDLDAISTPMELSNLKEQPPVYVNSQPNDVNQQQVSVVDTAATSTHATYDGADNLAWILDGTNNLEDSRLFDYLLTSKIAASTNAEASEWIENYMKIHHRGAEGEIFAKNTAQ